MGTNVQNAQNQPVSHFSVASGRYFGQRFMVVGSQHSVILKKIHTFIEHALVDSCSSTMYACFVSVGLSDALQVSLWCCAFSLQDMTPSTERLIIKFNEIDTSQLARVVKHRFIDDRLLHLLELICF